MTSKQSIDFQDWEKCDLRVGKITKVEDHPKADKLYTLSVNFGKEIGKRTIVAGLKQHYKKEELKNKKAVFIINLPQKEIRGIKSEGMTLASVNEDESIVCILQPEKDIEVGSKIR